MEQRLGEAFAGTVEYMVMGTHLRSGETALTSAWMIDISRGFPHYHLQACIGRAVSPSS